MKVNNKINKLNKPTTLTQFKYNNKSINIIKYKKYNRFVGLKTKNCFEPLSPPILLR